jgi:excisionase family DNA binding protein
MDTTPRELMTPAEVAAFFRVDVKTVIRWADAGKFGCFRTIGGHRRFYADEIRAFIEPAAQAELAAAAQALTKKARAAITPKDGAK